MHHHEREQRYEFKEKVKSGRRGGYGMNLYRNTDKKWIAGVCSGLSDHFEIDRKVMRLIFAGIFIISSGFFAFWAYVIAWVLMSPRPRHEVEAPVEYDEYEKCYRRKKIFRYRESPSTRIKRARQRLDTVLYDVEKMEHYVTSNRYRLDSEFAELEK